MLREVRAVGERFYTMCAFVWLRLPHVHLAMHVMKLRFGVEALKDE